jgi:hypothetical protein
MENKVVIKGEFKGSKVYFRTVKKSEKVKLDCIGFLLKTIKVKRKLKK